MAVQRLQKLIAAAGLASRRRAEEWIAAGRVTVDGAVVCEPGCQVDPELADVCVDGVPLPQPRRLVLALHKPVGVVTSVSDPHADRVVMDLLGDDVTERVYPAGRLDRDSEGLILMTNDGALMDALTRPGGNVAKVYEVTVRGRPAPRHIASLRGGIELRGRQLLPCGIDAIEESEPRSVYRVVLHEGKKNQIRRMFKSVGHPVSRLIRTRVGTVELGDLAAGAYRELPENELGELRAQAGIEATN